MEDMQTDTLPDYGKNQHQEAAENETNKETENASAGSLLNGCEEIDDPLDLMDHCDESIGSNSDVWKGSDSEDESFENKGNTADSNKNSENNEVEVRKTNSNDERDGEQSGEEINKESVPSSQQTDTGENVDVTQKASNGDNENAGDQSLQESSAIEPNNETVTELLEDDRSENQEKSNENPSGKDDDVNSEKLSDHAEKDDVNSEKLSDHAEKDMSNEVTAVVETDPLSCDAEKELSTAVERDPLTDDAQDTDNAKQANKSGEGQDDESQMDYDDDDFDPSLLCPEVSMAVDENPVITTSGHPPIDGDGSLLPCEPVLSTYFDEVTGAEVSFNLSPEEQELRRRLYGPTNPIQMTRLHCTACNVHLGSALEGQNNRFVHPMLKVLICKECYHFYTSGEFEKDEDGSELYCRWCGQGGQVLCCSKCEYVFCKRCIRTNFGRKKMFEIRDSDNWDCFRCYISQITTQRIACYEFFEFIRREMARASTLKSPEIWAKDYSRCCASRKRIGENGEVVVKKTKKRKLETDPDYNPLVDKPVVPPGTLLSSSDGQVVSHKLMVPSTSLKVVPNYNKSKDNDIEFVRHIPAPQVVVNPIRPGAMLARGPASQLKAANIIPSYRTILPSNIRPMLQNSALMRMNPQQLSPLTPTGNRLLGNALQGRALNNASMMKHEWFEKTVRAAARVNSHLSYTLTQLNKAQSQAASVEELAVVHNKLQEILSSSINSLIQIRKNLRNEFIAGIKTVRLPSKKAQSYANDDDVIFVSDPSPLPVPSTSTSTNTVPVDKPTAPTPITSNNNTTAPLKGYLKVKSFNDLQNVPSECITIPEDVPAPPPPQAEIKNVDASETSKVVCNGGTSAEETSSPGDSTVGSKCKPSERLEASGSTVGSKCKPSERFARSGKTEKVLIKEAKSKKKKIANQSSAKGEPTSDTKLKFSVVVNVDRMDLEQLQKRLRSEIK